MERITGKMGTAAASVVALTGVALLAGCECAPPVRECVATRTEVEVTRPICPPVKTTSTVTVIRRTDVACPALPPVGEITVVRNSCARTKMIFVNVRPDDRYYNVETRNFERPWPWGPYGMGEGQY